MQAPDALALTYQSDRDFRCAPARASRDALRSAGAAPPRGALRTMRAMGQREPGA